MRTSCQTRPGNYSLCPTAITVPRCDRRPEASMLAPVSGGEKYGWRGWQHRLLEVRAPRVRRRPIKNGPESLAKKLREPDPRTSEAATPSARSSGEKGL